MAARPSRSAVLLLLGGRAADLLGRRTVFLAGLAVFSGASLVAALAPSAGVLLAARAAQGLGGHAVAGRAVARHDDLRRGLSAGAPWLHGQRSRRAARVRSAGRGPSHRDARVAGDLPDQPPVGIAAAVAARLLPAPAPTGRGRLDAGGALIATASPRGTLYGLVQAPEAGWASPQTLGLLAAPPPALRASCWSSHACPSRSCVLGCSGATATALVLMLAGMGTVLSAFFFSSIYLQDVLSHSALRTGLEFPGCAPARGGRAGGRLVERRGAKPVLAGGMALGGAGAYRWCLRERLVVACPACSSSTSASPRLRRSSSPRWPGWARRKSAWSPD